MKPLIILSVLLALAACSSPEERARETAQRAVDSCTAKGFQPDTEPFDDCTLSFRQQEKESRKADSIAAGEQIRDFQSNHPGQTTPGGRCVTC